MAGMCAFGPARDAGDTDNGELYAINVHPRVWGTGLGTGLLHAAKRGLAGSAHLWVVDGNARARRFYERHDWQADGGRKARRPVRDRGHRTALPAAAGNELTYRRLIAGLLAERCEPTLSAGSSMVRTTPGWLGSPTDEV